MNENERIVCEFLREIAPSREWRYLGEVEHYLIGELCDELNKQLNAENAKLRELVEDMAAEIRGLGIDFKRVGWCEYADRMRELGVDA